MEMKKQKEKEILKGTTKDLIKLQRIIVQQAVEEAFKETIELVNLERKLEIELTTREIVLEEKKHE